MKRYDWDGIGGFDEFNPGEEFYEGAAWYAVKDVDALLLEKERENAWLRVELMKAGVGIMPAEAVRDLIGPEPTIERISSKTSKLNALLDDMAEKRKAGSAISFGPVFHMEEGKEPAQADMASPQKVDDAKANVHDDPACPKTGT